MYHLIDGRKEKVNNTSLSENYRDQSGSYPKTTVQWILYAVASIIFIIAVVLVFTSKDELSRMIAWLTVLGH